MPTTPDFGLPELSQGQANADVTFNTSLRLVQAILNGVIDRTNTPPVSPAEQDAYLLSTLPTGAWAGKANKIAVYIGGEWKFVPGNDDSGTPIVMGAAQEGLRVYVRDEDAIYTWCDTAASPADFEWRVSTSGGGTAGSFTFAASDRLLGRDTIGGGAGEEISVGGGIEFTGAGALRTSAFTGDVTKTAGGTAQTIATNAVTDAKFRQSAALSVVGRSANSTGDVADVTAGTDGHVLRRSGTTLGFGTIADAAVPTNTLSLSKLVNASAQYNLIGRTSASAGAWEQKATSSDVFAMLGAANNAAIIAAVGLGAYSEGTWTPVFTSTTPGTISYTGTPLGRWTRIGNFVAVELYCDIVLTKGTASGAVRVTGLPFTIAASIFPIAPLTGVALVMPANTANACALGLPGSTTLAFQSISDSGGASALDIAGIPNGGVAIFSSITYRV